MIPSLQQTAPGGTQGIPTESKSITESWEWERRLLTWARRYITRRAVLSTFQKRGSFQHIGDIWRRSISCNYCQQEADGCKDSCGYHDARRLVQTNMGEIIIQDILGDWRTAELSWYLNDRRSHLEVDVFSRRAYIENYRCQGKLHLITRWELAKWFHATYNVKV